MSPLATREKNAKKKKRYLIFLQWTQWFCFEILNCNFYCNIHWISFNYCTGSHLIGTRLVKKKKKTWNFVIFYFTPIKLDFPFVTWIILTVLILTVCKIIRTFTHYRLRSYNVIPCPVCLTVITKYKWTVRLYLAIAVRHTWRDMTSYDLKR